MKRIYPLLLLSVFFICDISIYAQETDNISTQEVDSVVVDSTNLAEESPEVTAQEETSLGFTQELKKRFIEGGPGFMGIVLLCLILGLAIAIERIIFLNLSDTNVKKFVDSRIFSIFFIFKMRLHGMHHFLNYCCNCMQHH